MGDVAIEGAVRSAIALGRAAWPAITVDPQVFRQALLRGVAGHPDPGHAIGQLCVPDLYLAQACARGDASALDVFGREYLSRIQSFLARHAARPLADDVRQLVCERLLLPRSGALPRIGDYLGGGPLQSWLRVVTLRVAANLISKEGRHRDHVDVGNQDLAAAALVDVPELTVLEGRYRREFRSAFRRGIAALPSDERAMLKLHFIDGITIRQLEPVLRMSRAAIGRRLLAAQHRLADLVLAELARDTQRPVQALKSVVRVLLSKLQVSLSALT
jgi:RNA polymerase sigma-70 factor (ECF subfamily)